MTDQAGGLVNNSRGQSKQSSWMAHWMQTSRNAAGETLYFAAPGDVQPETVRDDNLKTGLNFPRAVEKLRVVETKSFEIMNENARMSHKSNRGMHNSFFKNDKDNDSIPTPMPLCGHSFESGKAVQYGSETLFPSVSPAISSANMNSSRIRHFPNEGGAKNPCGWISAPLYVKDISFRTPKPLPETCVESSSQSVPYRLNLGKTTFFSFTTKPTILSNKQLPEHECCIEHTQPSDIVRKRKMGSLLCLDNSVNVFFQESKSPLVLDSPSTSDHQLPSFGPELFPEMKYSSFGLFPSPCSSSEKGKSKKSDCDHYSLSANCDHDVEAMRICTMVDSVKGLPGGFPMFSHTTQSLVITKKTDVGPSKGNDIYESKRVESKIHGKTLSDFHILAPFFPHSNRGVRLQSLSSSTDTEAKEGNAEASKPTMQNESSDETDTMDMDALMEKNLLSSVNCGPSAEPSYYDNEKLPPQLDPASSRDVKCQSLKTGLLDINLEVPASPASANSLENACASSSHTQCLELDVLTSRFEQHKTKSKHSLDDSMKTDPSSRWVKRLKLSSSNSSSQAMKISISPENTSHEKMGKFFSRITKNNITSSEATLTEQRGKESSLPCKSGNVVKECQDFPKNKGKELLLSHSWVQRWLSNESRISHKKAQEKVVCEPQSSKLAPEDIEKKQFPSIAAMALMGKAMSGFQQCELQKRGSFIVWNTKAF